jgi:hypothetical protein
MKKRCLFTLNLGLILILLFLVIGLYSFSFQYQKDSQTLLLEKENQIIDLNNTISGMQPIYQKYSPVENALAELRNNTYDKDKYNCVNFSQDFQKKMKTLGYETELIIGDTPEGRHEWVALEIEPQNGELLKIKSSYAALDLEKNYYRNTMPAIEHK